MLVLEMSLLAIQVVVMWVLSVVPTLVAAWRAVKGAWASHAARRAAAREAKRGGGGGNAFDAAARAEQGGDSSSGEREESPA